MRQDGGGLGGYVWAGLTGILASLTPQDIMFGLGALVTAILGLLTYLSNDRRNKRIAEAAEKRNEILRLYVSKGEGEPPHQLTPKELDAIREIET